MLEILNVSKEYAMPRESLSVLENIDITLHAGDAVSIVGPSGSGKSTLLYILGALEPPSKGRVLLSGRNPYEMDERSLAAFRNEKIGFVFQDHHLLPQCSVFENVLIPTLVSRSNGDVHHRALSLIEQVGLSSRISHRPHELSGGEKQRVALARALIMNPQLLLCDEPTGNLDHASADTVVSLLFELHEKQKNILVVVTHNMDVAARFGMKYRLADARLVGLKDL